jgi:hypothetical protein
MVVTPSSTDVDMATSDTTKNTAHEYIYQVISSSESKIYYPVIRDKSTSPILVTCLIAGDLYKPRVKMRETGQRRFIHGKQFMIFMY